MGNIVLEDFNEGNGYYKINLAYLNKEQVEEIEAIVSKWKPTDEDIKSCIATCLTDANEQRFKDYGTNLKDCLAWLEKQGEQKVSIVDFKAEDWYVSKVDGKIHYMKYNPNKGLVWSEDDERMHNASIRACQYMVENFENSTRDYEDAIDWLKSLKNKVQPKQEWSEKDETALCDVLWCCKQAASIAKDENDMGNIWYAEKWLKSLKDRYSWKPSKEQMKGIDCAIKTLRHQLNVEDKRLNSLYEQLKKL